VAFTADATLTYLRDRYIDALSVGLSGELGGEVRISRIEHHIETRIVLI
jgi:hypothetical protein